MCQAQASDATQNGDSQVQKTPQDSQISSLAQLGDAGSSNAWNTQGKQNEQQAGNLTMNSMFNGTLASELGLGGNAAAHDTAAQGNSGNGLGLSSMQQQLSQWGTEFQTLGSDLKAVGQDFTQLGQDLATTQNDIGQLMNALGGAANGQQPAGSDQPAGYTPPAAPAGSDSGAGQPPATPAGSDTGAGQPPATPAGSDSGAGQPPATPAGSDTGAGQPPATPAGSDGAGGQTTNIPPVNTTGDGSGYAVQNGQLRINGQLVDGIAVTSNWIQQVGADTAANDIKSQFPGINTIRLATSPLGGAFTEGQDQQGGASADDVNNMIKAFNSAGIGVIVDNHNSDANSPNNAGENSTEAAWFGQLAQANLGNNMVMFQTENEPTGDGSSIQQEQQSAYDAIRATGSNAVVAFEYSTAAFQSNPNAYSQDSNYVVDLHAYDGGSQYPWAGDIAGNMQAMYQTGITEADGTKVPVYIGETGNAIDGANIDPNGNAVMDTAWSDGTGAVAWLYDGAATGYAGASADGIGADMMTNPDGSITGYGQQIASRIAKGAS